MPKEKLWVTETDPLTDNILYTITANRERTMYYLNDAFGKRLHKADNPMKFEKDIQRLKKNLGGDFNEIKGFVNSFRDICA